VPTLDALLAGRHSVVAAVSQPDRRRGRGRKTTPSPVAQRALDAGIRLLRPDRAGDPEVAQELAQVEPDLGVVVAFGQFLPKRIRELPRLGYLINAHASLLPRLRGAAPIAYSLLEGHDETGISIMRVEREMDAGPVALVRRTPIEPDDDCGTLSERLATLAAEAVVEALDRAAAGTLAFEEQDAAAASFAPKLERADQQLDLREPADALVRRVRALAPRPGAVVELDGEPLRILRARSRHEPVDAAPGSARRADGELRIATGDGWLEPLILQRAGKRPLTVAEFLRGHSVSDGARFAAKG
jgi:methionyl-tRNA formyltransferase